MVLSNIKTCHVKQRIKNADKKAIDAKDTPAHITTKKHFDTIYFMFIHHSIHCLGVHHDLTIRIFLHT